MQSEIDRLANLEKNGGEVDLRQINSLKLKLKQLSAYRYRWIQNNFHKISRRLVNILYQTGHRVIYIGKNAVESKNEINLGKKTNQLYVGIPFRRLIDMIKYKARQFGMEVIEVDEAYTSRTSPFANIIEIQETKNKELCGGRRKGNLFKDFVLNKIFHADLVGALNILRAGAKLLKLNFYENLKVLFAKLCNPIRLKLIDFIYKVSPESLWIGGRRQSLIDSAGWMEKQGSLITSET